MNAQAGTITIQITDKGGAVLSCSACGELRTEDDARQVAARIGTLAKSHASLHAVGAAQGLSFGFVHALLEAGERP